MATTDAQKASGMKTGPAAGAKTGKKKVRKNLNHVLFGNGVNSRHIT